MATKLNRRNFIISAAAVSVSLYVGGSWFISQRRSLEVHIANLIKTKLSYLNINEEALMQYASTAIENGFEATKLWKYKGHLYTRFRQIDLDIDKRAESFASHFLMSSDFFWNGADVSKEVNYRVYYDPARQPCLNPFANLNSTA